MYDHINRLLTDFGNAQGLAAGYFFQKKAATSASMVIRRVQGWWKGSIKDFSAAAEQGAGRLSADALAGAGPVNADIVRI